MRGPSPMVHYMLVILSPQLSNHNKCQVRAFHRTGPPLKLMGCTHTVISFICFHWVGMIFINNILLFIRFGPHPLLLPLFLPLH